MQTGRHADEPDLTARLAAVLTGAIPPRAFSGRNRSRRARGALSLDRLVGHRQGGHRSA